MKDWQILLLLVFLAFVQVSLLPWNFLLVFVVVASFFFKEKAFLLAFLAGFFLDVATGAPLGFSSILFLFFSLVVVVFLARLSSANPLVCFFLTLFFYLLWQFFFKAPPKILEAVVLSFLVAFFSLRREKEVLS